MIIQINIKKEYQYIEYYQKNVNIYVSICTLISLLSLSLISVLLLFCSPWKLLINVTEIVNNTDKKLINKIKNTNIRTLGRRGG